MADVETANRLHDFLCSITANLAPLDDDAGELDEMTNPMLTEWVLVANVADLDHDEYRLVLLTAPTMLHSHALGLLTMAARL